MSGDRVAFAAGDFLTRYPPGHHYDLRIESPIGRPAWKPRSFSPIGQSMFPGSAIEFEGIYYEIVFQDYDPGPPEMNSYYLKRWDDTQVIRTQFHYNEEECRKEKISLRERKSTNQKQIVLSLFAPLLGMLPDEDQIRISNRFGISATRMTSLSAFTLLIPGGYY